MRTLAVAVIALNVIGAFIGTLLPELVAGGPEQIHMPRDLAFPALFLAAGITGAVIMRYRPDHPIGWILGLSSVIGAAEHTIAGYAAVALYGGQLPGGIVAAWIFSWLEVFHLAPLATFALLLFPTGHLPSRRWRPVAWLSGLNMVVLAAIQMIVPAPIPVFGIPNPYAWTSSGEILLPLAAASFALFGVCAIASAASLARRYRRSGPADRRKIKWVAFAGLLVVPSTLVIVGLGLSLELTALIATLAYIPIPIAMTVAIIRDRLFDIDRLIDRTLVYGSVSAVLAATYLVAVVSLQDLLAPLTAGSDVAVAGSTLLVVALFQPVRGRIQNAVDRRFYRSRYDASRTLDQFAARLRDEVDLDAVRDDLLAIVGDTIHPSHANVWFRDLRREGRNAFRTVGT